MDLWPGSLSTPEGRKLAGTIAGGDAARLQTLPGVGKKLAERIVVECREGAAILGASAPRPAPAAVADGVLEEAVSALVNLGYRRPEAEQAIARVRRPNAPLEEHAAAATNKFDVFDAIAKEKDVDGVGSVAVASLYRAQQERMLLMPGTALAVRRMIGQVPETRSDRAPGGVDARDQ